MLSIKDGEDIFNHVTEHDAILLGTNLYASMANGLQLDVSLNYPYVYDDNMSTKYGDIRKLGTILESVREGSPMFVICYITKGYNCRPDLNGGCYLEYEALENCLKLINARYQGMNIGSPILGSSKFDGNGDKERILDLFRRHITNSDLTLYDYEQLSRSEKMKLLRRKELEIKSTDIKAYYEAVKHRKAEAELRFKKNKRRRY